MAQVINNSDALTFILTSYGLSRIAEALANPIEDIHISKIKVGDANFEYYEPTENQPELVHPIDGGEFYIVEKELLEDEMTISFHAIIPETFYPAEIREVGIYETVDGVDKLFAVSTQQPLLKPYMDLNYLISVDYYAFLKAQNLADIYDQIVLNPDNQLVSGEDLENLMSTILFSESNLMEQINSNTRVIGLNRVQQLQERMDTDREHFGYAITYDNYSTLLDYTSADNIFGYWFFNYPRRTSPRASVTDIGKFGRNFSLSKSISSFTRNYDGVMPSLTINSPNYYYLDQGDSENRLIFTNETETHDISFTVIFAVEPLSTSATRTLLARSDYSTNAHTFEINETSNGEIEVILFSDSDNYITFKSDVNIVPSTMHSLIISYDAENQTVTAYINSVKVGITSNTTGNYNHMNSPLSTLYAFTYTPTYSVYADSSTNPEYLYNADGTPNTNNDFSTSNYVVFYKGNIMTYSGTSVNTDALYAWAPQDSSITDRIYTKSTTITENIPLYNSDYTPYTDTKFKSEYVDGAWKITYEGISTARDSSKDVASKTLYNFTYSSALQTIWANSNTHPTILYYSSGNLYDGDDWEPRDNHVYYKDGNAATYTESANLNIETLPVTSYVINSSGVPSQYVNSNVGVVSVIKDLLNDDQLRAIALNLEASMGKNPCIIAY